MGSASVDWVYVTSKLTWGLVCPSPIDKIGTGVNAPGREIPTRMEPKAFLGLPRYSQML